MVFQLVIGLSFILCSFAAYGRALRGAPVRGLAKVQMVLLLLFPFWLGLYVNGVINNSDGAASDLSVYPHIGLLVYILLLALTINTFLKSATGKAYPMRSSVAGVLATVQLAFLLLLPFWLGPILVRGVNHNEAIVGLFLYSCIGLLTYVLLLVFTITTIVNCIKQSTR